MNKAVIILILGAATMICAGCLNVETPREINVGNVDSGPPPEVDCGDTPANYNAALAAWRDLCQYNAYLERRIAKAEEKYEDAQKDKEEYKRKYKKLKDKYED